MGRKRNRTREFIHLCIASLIFFVLLGCTLLKEKDKVDFKKDEVEKEKVQNEDIQKEQNLKIISESLLRAKRLLERRDFDGALKENQKVLSLSDKNSPGDEALFNMGLVYAHFGNPKRDYGKALLFFNKLAKDFPQSPWVDQAKIWVGMLQENQKLNQTIQKLNQVLEESKQVDIEIEERKRERAK